MHCPLAFTVACLAYIVLILSLRRSLISENFFPGIAEVAFWQISIALSQFTHLSATRPAYRDTRRSVSYPANGSCACSRSTNTQRSLAFLACVIWRESLCCSDTPVCTTVNCSTESQIGKQRGSAWTYPTCCPRTALCLSRTHRRLEAPPLLCETNYSAFSCCRTSSLC